MFLPFQFPLDTLIPDGKRIIWDSRKGFIISNATYKEIGLLTCETTVNGHLFKTNYLTYRESKWCSKGMNISRNAQGFICLMKPWLLKNVISYACSQYNHRCPNPHTKPRQVTQRPYSHPQLHCYHALKHESSNDLELPWWSEWPIFLFLL